MLNISLFKLTLRCNEARLDSESILLISGCVKKPAWPRDLLRAMFRLAVS